MKVWIVSKIRMRENVWIHGLTEENQNIRILQPDGSYPSIRTKFKVGQIWDLTFHRASQIIPPHVENVIVTAWKFLNQESNLLNVLMERVIPWTGEPLQLFNGCLKSSMRTSDIFIAQGTYFPHKSIGYWISDIPLVKHHDRITSYQYGEFLINYTGFSEAIGVIPAKTLIHVSLKDWWIPSQPIEARPNANSNVQTRCYLQISSWYL